MNEVSQFLERFYRNINYPGFLFLIELKYLINILIHIILLNLWWSANRKIFPWTEKVDPFPILLSSLDIPLIKIKYFTHSTIYGLGSVNDKMICWNERDQVHDKNEFDNKIPNSSSELLLNDFTILALLGSGSYGEVLLIRRKATDKQYALKVIDKAFLKRVE